MVRWLQNSLLGLAALAGSGCATPGTRPHDMAAEQHEKAAARAATEAAEHDAGFDPTQTKSTRVCRGRGPCWTEEVNPSAEHRHHAQKLRAAAAEHRAAAQALRDAEAVSCASLSEEDRDLGPFFHRGDVERVEPLHANAGRDRSVRGALITFRPVAGLTSEWMQRSLDCHLARNAALGFDAPEMGHCPLAPRGVRATARESGGRVVVEVVAPDASAVQAVLTRAQLLAPR
jgi:hypothetical protein